MAIILLQNLINTEIDFILPLSVLDVLTEFIFRDFQCASSAINKFSPRLKTTTRYWVTSALNFCEG